MDYRRQEVVDTAQDSSQWLFEHKSYTSWLSEQHGLLWITGKPGSGKSTLMKLIFNHFKQSNATDIVYLTFFFHRRGTQLQQTELGMLRTLLYQILQQFPITKAHFQKSFKEKTSHYGQAKIDWNWDESELRNIFKSALLTVVESHSIFIFIDALDEGGEILARKVVEYLNQIDDSLAYYDKITHICFSCRHWPVIKINRGYNICLEDENCKDISLFALQELQKRIQDLEDTLVPPCLTEILDDITEKASGVFLWVALVIPNIAQQYNNGDSIKEIKTALSRVPTDLEYVFKHILTELKNSNKRDQSLHLMQWICLVKTPLNLTQLRHALASDNLAVKWPQASVRDSVGFVEDDARMRRLLRSLSGGLAELKSHRRHGSLLASDGFYTEKNDLIQFIHQSVLDYMLRDGLKLLDISLEQDPIGKGHDRLAKSCLNYFNFREVRTLQIRSKQEIYQMLEKLPFIEYAVENWPSHSGQADQRSIDQSHIIQRLGWCKDGSFAHWSALCEVLSHSWKMSLAVANTSLLHVAAGFNIISIATHGIKNTDLIEVQDLEGNRPLHCAAQSGYYKLVKMFIDAHAEVEVRNKRGYSPLQRAASGGHVNVLRLLLDVRQALATEETVLCAAVSCGSISSVSLLLDRGANANARGGGNKNVLSNAVDQGHEGISRLLIENGADVNAHRRGYRNILNVAASKGYEGISRILIENGADINAHGEGNRNALNAAVDQGHEGISRLLIENGADINANEGGYRSTLNIAASKGYEGIARLLIENGADINAHGGGYGTALGAAAHQGYEDIAKLLIENGADVNTNEGGYGSALGAAAHQGHEGIARLLIENGADVNAHGGGYGNVLSAAINKGHKGIARLLIENGANVNAEGGRDLNFLCITARWGDWDTVSLLLENGPKLESVKQQGWKALHISLRSGLWNEELMEVLGTLWTDKDNQGRSSIHLAASGGYVKGLERALEFQDDINTSDMYGWTAAHWAARSGSRKCCKLLGEAGCDFTKRDNGGLTASQIAIYCSHNWLHDILDPHNQMLAESKIVVYENLAHITCSCCFHVS